jgi:hypothetical protein
MSILDTLVVLGQTSIDDNFVVSGDLTSLLSASVRGPSVCGSSISVSSGGNLGGQLSVHSMLIATRGASIMLPVFCSDAISVVGPSILQGPLLSVAGFAVFYGQLSVADTALLNSVSIEDKFFVDADSSFFSGFVDVENSLSVTKSVEIDSSLEVFGCSFLHSQVSINDEVLISASISVDSITRLGSSLVVENESDTSLSGSLSVGTSVIVTLKVLVVVNAYGLVVVFNTTV